MPDVSKHKLSTVKNLDSTWKYSCSCGDEKSKLKSKATCSVVYKAHIAFVGRNKRN